MAQACSTSVIVTVIRIGIRQGELTRLSEVDVLVIQLTRIVCFPERLFEFEDDLVGGAEVNGLDGGDVARGKGRRKEVEMTLLQITQRG